MGALAAIDIGTNTALLLVVDHRGRVLEDVQTIVRLGEGVDGRGRLAPAAIERTLAALHDYRDRIERHGASAVAAVGTSALRDAANRDDLRGPAEEVLGCEIEVISGAREAELTLAGVLTSHPALSTGAVVFDIGGGSTELVAVGEDRRPASWVSLDIGTVRQTERHIASDPPHASELAAVRAACDRALQELPPAMPQRASRLVGIAGTVTTLVAVQLAMERYDPARIERSGLDARQIGALIARMKALPLRERSELPGLEPGRADLILAGGVLVQAVMARLSARRLEASGRGVRWGLIEQLRGG